MSRHPPLPVTETSCKQPQRTEAIEVKTQTSPSPALQGGQVRPKDRNVIRIKNSAPCLTKVIAWMRVASGRTSVGLGLTHKILSPKSIVLPRFSRFFHPSPLTNAKKTLPKTNTPIPFKMASSGLDTPDWNALRVRETFLNYFKERGHTFCSLRYTPPSLDLNTNPRLPCSSLIFSCPAFGPDTAIYKCWNEPVQVDILRNR